MLLNIKLIKTTSMFCIESSAASVAKWLNRNYEMMFARMWGFEFFPAAGQDANIIGKRLSCGYSNNDILEGLKDYHGLRINAKQLVHMDTVITDIFNELNKGMPIAINLDDFNFPWLEKKQEIGFLLIIGYTENNELLCLDIHNGFEDVKVLSIDCLLKNEGVLKNRYREYYTFLIESEEKKNIDYYDFLINLKKSKSLNNNPFKAMRNFADCIKDGIDFNVERCNIKDIYFSPLLLNVMHITRARKLLSSTLNYLWEITNDKLLFNLSMEFMALGGDWHFVWYQLNKPFYFPDNNNTRLLTKISDKIKEIADKEESLISELINDKYNRTSNAYLHRTTLTESVYNNSIILDIKDYLNNKAFSATMSNEEGADFTGQGEFFLMNGLPDNHIFSLDYVKFTLMKNEKGFDNISCSNQIIKIPLGNYKKITFLGCSEWGEGFGQMNVIYADNQIESAFLTFPDWYNNNVVDTTRVWKGQIVGINNSIEERSIFAVSYILNCNLMIKEIKLPAIENIHIFGISLEKAI